MGPAAKVRQEEVDRLIAKAQEKARPFKRGLGLSSLTPSSEQEFVL